MERERGGFRQAAGGKGERGPRGECIFKVPHFERKTRAKSGRRRIGGPAAAIYYTLQLSGASFPVGRPVVIGGVISSLDITFALAPARPLDLRNVIGSQVGNKIRTSSRLPPQMPLSEAFQEIYAFPKKGRSNECT